MFCSRCGNQVSELYRFCNICGNPLVLPVSFVEPTVTADELQPIAPLNSVTEITTEPAFEEPSLLKPAELIRAYDIPDIVKRDLANIQTIKLFEDRLVCTLNSGLQNIFSFEKYPSVSLITAGKETQYAQIVMIPQGQQNTFDPKKNINSLNYPNKLPFCSGLLNTEPANAFARELYQDIHSAICAYHSLDAE